jgi:hypothetical protein
MTILTIEIEIQGDIDPQEIVDQIERTMEPGAEVASADHWESIQ